jgi:hypothetical protein
MQKILTSFTVFLMIGLGGVAARGQNQPQDQQYDQPYPDQQAQQYPQAPPPPQDQMPPQAQGQGQAPPPPAGQQAPNPQQAGQPAPGVARLSFVHGDVSQQRGDNAQWVAATLNTPIEPGDRVSTGGQDARAELQLDYANVLRMSNNVTANVTTLTRNRIQIQVGQGLTTYSVLRGSEADSEIDTPNAAIHPLGEGEYRILVNSNAETEVIIRSGSAEISTPQGSTRVEKGQMITVAGTTDNAQYKTDPAPAKDEWDSWNNDRDKRVESAQSWQHTDRYYTGSEDLDRNGTWSEIPDYGPVWAPANVDPGWAPYRAGRWVYEPYYGWTWVSYEPWGWAPYHYGRWMVYGGSWVWWPGPVAAYPGYYPIWSPAYVSFFGFGGGGWGLGFGFGFGFGGFGRVGWLPVGPGDWYHPWYGGWGARYNAVGVGAFGALHEGFSPLGAGRFSTFDRAAGDARVRGGFSSMAGNEFGRGAVSMHQEAISEASFRQASAMAGRMPVSPSRESFSPSNREPSASTIRNGSAAGSQRFFSSSRGSEGAGAGFRGSSSSGFSNNAGRSVQGGTQGGWNRFTPPSHSASQSQSSARGYSSPNAQRQFDSSNTATRGGYGGSSNSYNRTPLNMRQPIGTPRGGYNESRSGGYSGGSYSAPRGAYSAPRGSYSAPSAPRGGSSGGSSHGGGGGSHGGGHSGGRR